MDVSGISPAITAASSASTGAGASIKVMKMAEESVEDTFSILLQSLDAMISGLGQNLDSTA